MRKLEKFIIGEGSTTTLSKDQMSKISGAQGGGTSFCRSYEHTCEDNCQDREWVHVTDGVETWRLRVVLTSDC